MIVSELIKILKQMPQDAEVYHLWDGEPRTKINVVWESQCGDVITADFNENCYTEENCPRDVTLDDSGIWHTPNKENVPLSAYILDTSVKLSKKWIRSKYKEILE